MSIESQLLAKYISKEHNVEASVVRIEYEINGNIGYYFEGHNRITNSGFSGSTTVSYLDLLEFIYESKNK